MPESSFQAKTGEIDGIRIRSNGGYLGGANMLNTLVSIIDKTLRARQGIIEYSDCPNCLFRIDVAVITGEIALSDGTYLAAGSRLVNLHIWNEHVPPFPSGGPTLAWARQMCRDVELSLRELATFLESQAALEDVVAIGGNMSFGSADQTGFLADMAARYGFVRAADSAAGTSSISQKLHLLGENILISMIVISHNPAAARIGWLDRDRVPVYIRRAELIKRFGTLETARPVH